MGNQQARPEDVMAAREWIQGIVAANRIAVFTKSGCPYCTMAVTALKTLSVPFHVEDISRRPDMEAIQQAFNEITGARSVPRVWVNGTFIGGGTDTKAAVENGTIQKMLSAA